MKHSIVVSIAAVAFGAGLAARQAPQGANAFVPSVTAKTPTDCLARLREYVAARNNDGTQAEQINSQKAAMAAGCVLKFDEKATPDTEIVSLLDLYIESYNFATAQPVVDRALALTTLSSAARARVLVAAVSVELRMKPTTPGRAGRQDEMSPRVEQIVA